MANEIAKKDAAPVAAANTERPNTENKVKVKKNTKADIIMARLDDTSPDGIMAMVTDMTGDKDFGKKFVTYAKLQIKNGWKQDKATGKWTNSFNLVPVESVFECLMACARRKVLPDGYNAYLAVYAGRNPRCQLLVDYKGLIDTAIAEGIVQDVNAKEVRENDDIDIDFGEVTRFKIDPRKPRGEIIGCVAYAILPNGRRKSVFLDLAELKQIRDCAQTDEVWGSWEVEMYKKSAIRRLFKTTRNTPRMNALMAIDNDSFELANAKPLPSAKGKESPVPMLAGTPATALPAPEAEQEEPAPEAEPIPVEVEPEAETAHEVIGEGELF